MTAKAQDILKPESQPPVGSQAFSPLGCFIAAAGATLLMFTQTSAAMVVSVWAFSKLLGLPALIMDGVMALGAIPVLWLTFWTAGRAWEVERRLARGEDVGTPVFKLGHYFRKA
jgi:hypothetical protein